jgi:hypothetical protein
VIRHAALITGIVFVVAAAATAQEGAYRAVDSPFQDGFEFEVNSTLEPMVEVAGVRWTRFGLHIKGGRDIDTGKEMPVTVELGFVNTNLDNVRVLVIALLEDAAGNQLHRVECSRFGANSDRLKEETQKFKIPGLVLQSVRQVYLFCEIE